MEPHQLAVPRPQEFDFKKVETPFLDIAIPWVCLGPGKGMCRNFFQVMLLRTFPGLSD
jgi:hypothetical protein